MLRDPTQRITSLGYILHKIKAGLHSDPLLLRLGVIISLMDEADNCCNDSADSLLWICLTISLK